MVELISFSVAWLVMRGSWHPRWLLASCSWDLDRRDGHLGFQMSWGGIYGGISQLALEPTVTFILQPGITEMAASSQPQSTHTYLSGSCASFCLGWRGRRVCAGNCGTICKLGKLHKQQMLMWWVWIPNTSSENTFSWKMSLKWKIFIFKHSSKGVMGIIAALKNLSHLFALNT